MKYVQKIAVISVLLLLSLSIINSCSDDSEEDLIIVSQNFLEKNDKTEWLLSKENMSVYIRLNKDINPLIEQWSYQSDLDCYVYNANIFQPGNFTIKENSAEKLVIDCDAIFGDCDCMTLTQKENTLQVDIKINEWQEETVYFNIVRNKVDELEKCNDDFSKNYFKLLFWLE
mgnify:CR=1 FL=1